MDNIDENIQVGKKVDLNLSIPLRNQILQIAIQNQFKTIEAYSKVIERFGSFSPFINVLEAEIRHIDELNQLLLKYNVSMPTNNWVGEIQCHDDITECIELAIALEIKTIKLYDDLLVYVEDHDIQDAFFRFQASSFNHHLVAFRAALKNQYENNGQQENKIFEKMDEYSQIIQKIASGKMQPEEMVGLLNNSNLPFVGGVVLGGMATVLLAQFLENKDKE